METGRTKCTNHRASSGIGQASGVRFTQEGAKSPSIAAAESNATLLLQADVSNEGQVQEMLRRTLGTFGRLDVLADHAGIQKPTAGHEIEMADFDRILPTDRRGHSYARAQPCGTSWRGADPAWS